MSKTGGISAPLCTEPRSSHAANSQPKPNDAFVELHDFVFGNGETLASLKLHYLTLGTPRRDASGAIANGLLLLHGTAGSAADLVQAAFFDAVYGAGEPLDLSRYFLVIPDACEKASKIDPSTMR
jgi:homoserine O-acetyltransferase/O-succinyltransferase